MKPQTFISTPPSLEHLEQTRLTMVAKTAAHTLAERLAEIEERQARTTQQPTSNGSPFDSKTLPLWIHQETFDAITAHYLPIARALPGIQRLFTIGGTTADFHEALSHGLPEATNTHLYRKFVSGNCALSPFLAIASTLRDAQ